MIGLATFLVWYLDNTGTHTVASYAYVDATSPAEAHGMVTAWGVELAAVKASIVDAPQYERASARRFYLESEASS